MAKPFFTEVFQESIRLKKIAFGKVLFQRVRVWENYKQMKIEKYQLQSSLIAYIILYSSVAYPTVPDSLWAILACMV